MRRSSHPKSVSTGVWEPNGRRPRPASENPGDLWDSTIPVPHPDRNPPLGRARPGSLLRVCRLRVRFPLGTDTGPSGWEVRQDPTGRSGPSR